MNPLAKYATLVSAFNSCDKAKADLSALKNTYVFKPRIVGRINNAIEAMDIITTVLLGLMNIEEQEISNKLEF